MILNNNSIILYNKNGQPFKINKTFRKNKNTYCIVEFIDTGSVREVRKSVVDEGTVNNHVPSFAEKHGLQAGKIS